MIVHGDAFELVPRLASSSFDAIVTSPPYADARRSDYPTAPADEFAGWIAPLLQELRAAGLVVAAIADRLHTSDARVRRILREAAA